TEAVATGAATTTADATETSGGDESTEAESGTETEAGTETGAAPAPKKRGRPKKAESTTRKGQLTVTLTGTADGGDWQVDVVQGTKRVVSKLAVPGASVAAAAAELHEDVAVAV